MGLGTTYTFCGMLMIVYVFTTIITVFIKILSCFQLNPGVSDPDMYLGGKLRMMRMENDIWTWPMSPMKYVGVSH